jgi:hypothetical protein
MPTSVAELLALLESFPWETWSRERFEPGFRQIYRDLVVTAGKAAAAAQGRPWNPDDPFLSAFVTDYVGERIVSLEATTRDRVAALIRRVLDEGRALSPTDLGRVLQAAVTDEFAEMARWRANMIARTETAIAANHGTVMGLRQADVDRVEVVDGTGDAACAAANGQVWTIEEALANPIEHPNCVRTFVPYLEAEE